MDITLAIQRVQALWRQVEGIRPDHAPDEPRDNLDFPMVLTYEAESETDVSQMYSGTFSPQKGILRSDLHLSRTNLKDSVQLARKMVKAFLLLVKADPNLNGTLMIVKPIRAQFMQFEYGAVVTIGYRVEIDYESELTT